jgi:hypothetical protein
MNILRTMRLVSGTLAPLALVGIVGAAQAAPLSVDSVSAMEAARQISDKYGVNVVFKGDFGPPHPVSFTVADADSSGGRLETINALANAIGADFTKTYVISRVAEGQDTPPVHIDSNANVAFQSATVSAQDAISAVAAVDNASVQMPETMGGTVTLSATEMNDADAAKEIAAQTHTRWKVFYALTPRLAGHQVVGKVVGRTSSGQPITELPYMYYKHPPTAAELQAQKVAAEQAVAANQATAQQAAMNQQGMAAQSANNGYSPYGYNPFAYDPNNYNYLDPYGYGGYSGPFGGYGGFEGVAAPGTNIGSGLVIGSGGGLVFQNGFGYPYP